MALHLDETLLWVFFFKQIILYFVSLFGTEIGEHDVSNKILDCNPLLVHYSSVGSDFATVMVSSKLVETIKNNEWEI